MPPRKTISAPANRVYKFSTPLQQARLPDMRRRSGITYGKRNGPPKLAKQDTLTQMDFVSVDMHAREEEEEEDDVSDYGEEIKKPRRKRRKTAGDANDQSDKENEGPKAKRSKRSNKGRRKTTGDEAVSTPQYHTQTITQIPDWIVTPAPAPNEHHGGDDFLEDPLPQKDPEAEEEFDEGIFDVTTSSQILNSHKKAAQAGESNLASRQRSPTSKKPSKGSMGPPQTPRRPLAREIPSSESPATPLSAISKATGSGHLPSENRTDSTPIPFNPHRRTAPDSHELPKLEIKDTFDTEESQLTRITSTPTKKSSPAKSVRFALPDSAEETPSSPSARPVSTPAPKNPEPAFRITKTEILDSDAESDYDFEDEAPISENSPHEELAHETCYGEIGEDTQRALSPILTGAVAEDEVSADEGHLDNITSMSSPVLDEVVIDTQEQSNLSRSMAEAEPPTSGTSDPEVDHTEQTEEPHKEGRTQYLESQRLATQHIAAMAPRTRGSDVFVTVSAQQVANIVERKKTHDIRAWSYPSSVCRIWMYEPAPAGRLKYMAAIGEPQLPGNIPDDGIGNAQFNLKTDSSWRAYEILELYELADPLSKAELDNREWLLKPPKKSTSVPPVVLDSLMANLLPPIFTQDDDEPTSSSTDTQEAAAQLFSTIEQFTQAPSSSKPTSVEAAPEDKISDDDVIPSSQQDLPRMFHGKNPSQATTVDLTQTQMQTPRKRADPEIVYESPTRPVASSTPLTLPALRSRSSGSVRDPPVPFSIASSQILTKSQMLPESYFDESVPGPPLIQDSDEEDY